MTLSNGLRMFFGKTSFTVSEAVGVNVSTGESDAVTGGFDVGSNRLLIHRQESRMFRYRSGARMIRAIYTGITAKKQTDGTYTVSVDPGPDTNIILVHIKFMYMLLWGMAYKILPAKRQRK